MARYIGPVCKLCRREGEKLFLKGERCQTEKCAFTRRSYPPGQHGQGRIKLSEYAIRLREKQKVRRVYGVQERQFRLYYDRANRMRGGTGEQMLALLERRLDSAVYRMGFGVTRREARQLVKHNHILVNGRRVNIPSYILRIGDKVEVRERSRKLKLLESSIAMAEARPVPGWMDLDRGSYSAVIKSSPLREELNEPAIREQLIVEYYSR
ncbi:MAG TPA: 30S ribosomal protein S4 [Polyangiaceae bacterium]|jgi:small subunit ribosomal protein S4|nr:MAG: 30S ribosomal protein S4 [Deltaproteobacteria bacterium ADurb.Bin207]HNS95443.1 30S ribosomal protein S4 [Polyangiaceae bacterium]HNZ20617.1 30S ribosomal protein S4 [Polyangiaceae bacterium]HOD20767.1 30S ribosomal protein S4 [Polyangiaceae bacterium]HOE47187.1 30S ribosomal protein S4 [Polyangiaceae bacterium]